MARARSLSPHLSPTRLPFKSPLQFIRRERVECTSDRLPDANVQGADSILIAEAAALARKGPRARCGAKIADGRGARLWEQLLAARCAWKDRTSRGNETLCKWTRVPGSEKDQGPPATIKANAQPVGRGEKVLPARLGVLELEKVVDVARDNASQLHNAARDGTMKDGGEAAVSDPLRGDATTVLRCVLSAREDAKGRQHPGEVHGLHLHAEPERDNGLGVDVAPDVDHGDGERHADNLGQGNVGRQARGSEDV